MPVPVWTWEYDFPLPGEREYEEVEIPGSPGYERGVIRGPANSRADGTGSVSSYRGRNVFQITVKDVLPFGAMDYFSEILDFLQARKDAGNEAFYWYNALENDCMATWTGDTASSGTNGAGVAVTNETGRYKVRFYGKLPWNHNQPRVADIGVLAFHEVFRA